MKAYIRLPLVRLIMDCRAKPGNDNIEATHLAY
jgi:hypothetical protein